MRSATGISSKNVVVAAVLAAAAGAAVVAVMMMDPTGRRGSDLAGEFTYDLTDLGRVDPKLILYDQTGRFDSGLERARAIAAGPGGRLYLAGDRKVRVFAAGGAAGEAVAEIATQGEPQAVTAGPDGTVYVAAADRVEVFGPDGRPRGAWARPPGEPRLTGIAAGEKDVFAADSGNGVVLRYDTSGRLIGRIGGKDPARKVPGLFLRGPHLDVAVGPDGLLRVNNPGRFLVEAYTPGGDRELWWGQAGRTIRDFCGCCNPVNLAVLPDGSVVTCEKGHRRVKLYDGEGGFLGVVAGPKTFADEGAAVPSGEGGGPTPVLDVAADETGAVWVLDTRTGIVRRFVRKEKP